MLCHIYIFRHGQTHFNKRKRFAGWMNAEWTRKGKINACRTAKKLRHKRIDVVFETKLIRSIHTLKEVRKYHPNALKLKDDRMIERCYGTLQGHSHKAFIRIQGKKLFDTYHRSYSVAPPHGESVKMVEKRVLSFIHDMLLFIKKYKVNVAISAHGNSMRPFRRYFEHASVKEMMKWEMPYDDYFTYAIEVPNGTRLQPTRNSWKSIHLPEHVQLAPDKKNVLKKYY